jgi:hypothetical protein
MVNSIPAKVLVDVIPNVLGAGGSALVLNGLILTTATTVPINTVRGFPTAEAVSDFFGPGSPEADLAAIYFQGFDSSNVKPGELLFAQYSLTLMAAYLRLGGISETYSLNELKAIPPGDINVTIDGKPFSGTVSLALATSYSDAANIIQNALNAGLPLGATACVVDYDSTTDAIIIKSGTTGEASTIGPPTGSLALVDAPAVISQGAKASTPTVFMDGILELAQNWACFMTAFNPDTTGHALKLEFAQWNSDQQNRFMYVCWDPDTSPRSVTPAPSSLGQAIMDADISGTYLLSSISTDITTGPELAAFVCGIAASVDFTQINGRTTFAYRSQAGLTPGVTAVTEASNLIANGYNFYGAYATANDRFIFMQNGQISGQFLWADSYIDQIWLNNEFQLDLMELMANARSIPYNAAGYSMIETALADTISQAGTFGVFRPGVTLSAAQKANVNNQAGANVADTLQSRGWFLQVRDATPQVRAMRGSPPCTFWYVDGQSIQKIVLSSIEVQ